jgi:hypothetical protein
MNITVLQNHQSGVDRAHIPDARATSFYAAKATLYGGDTLWYNLGGDSQ